LLRPPTGRDPRKVQAILLLAAVSFLIIIWQVNAVMGGRATLPERGVGQLMSPFQRAFNWIGRPLHDFWDGLVNGASLAGRNRDLEGQVEILTGRMADAQALKEENRRLQALLSLAEKQDFQGIAAQVIGRDPSNWFALLTIDKGSRQGVLENQVVTAPAGLVGIIWKAMPDTAQVKLILDSKDAVPGMVEGRGSWGMVYGQGRDRCLMRYLDSDARIKPGDRVVTSGWGDLYPAGQVIGRVVSVSGANSALFKEAELVPEVDFSTLDMVWVMRRVP